MRASQSLAPVRSSEDARRRALRPLVRCGDRLQTLVCRPWDCLASRIKIDALQFDREFRPASGIGEAQEGSVALRKLARDRQAIAVARAYRSAALEQARPDVFRKARTVIRDPDGDGLIAL